MLAEESRDEGEQRRIHSMQSPEQKNKYVSLSNNDRRSRFLRQLPLCMVCSAAFILSVLPLYSLDMFFLLIAMMIIYIVSWVTDMCMNVLVGNYWTLRQEVQTDWPAQWNRLKERSPEVEDDHYHVVIVPNYKENYDLLSQTIFALTKDGGNTLNAQKHMIVVLAMEAREGPEARERADALLKEYKHSFRDMFATFHPAKAIPGEVAGKSSNVQWAYLELLKRYRIQGQHNSIRTRTDLYPMYTSDPETYTEHPATSLSIKDASKVFVTVADADSIMHNNYFTCLSYKALSKSALKRDWTIWQSPMLFLRNYHKVPCFLRLYSHAVLVFELGGLLGNKGTHHCFSTYTVPLKLLMHHRVNGWDADVIAEDHHMFVKCLFASYYHEAEQSKTQIEPLRVESRLVLEPVLLPCVSYLVESDGWFKTMRARFQQARRHAEGVAELSYLVLQWFSFCDEFATSLWTRIPPFKVLNLLRKYITIHLGLQIHTSTMFALAVAGHVYVWRKYGVSLSFLENIRLVLLQDDRIIMVSTLLVLLHGTVLVFLISMATYVTISDYFSGLYRCALPSETGTMLLQNMAQDTHDVNDDSWARRFTPREPLYFYKRMFLLVRIVFESAILAPISVFFDSTIPMLLAVTSQGQHFEYVVAAKPGGSNSASAAEQGSTTMMIQQQDTPMTSTTASSASARRPLLCTPVKSRNSDTNMSTPNNHDTTCASSADGELTEVLTEQEQQVSPALDESVQM